MDYRRHPAGRTVPIAAWRHPNSPRRRSGSYRSHSVSTRRSASRLVLHRVGQVTCHLEQDPIMELLVRDLRVLDMKLLRMLPA